MSIQLAREASRNCLAAWPVTLWLSADTTSLCVTLSGARTSALLLFEAVLSHFTILWLIGHSSETLTLLGSSQVELPVPCRTSHPREEPLRGQGWYEAAAVPTRSHPHQEPPQPGPGGSTAKPGPSAGGRERSKPIWHIS